MKIAYICSPYRAKNDFELDRNIEYAQMLTRKALMDGYAPITPHLYMTQCLNEEDLAERELGMHAGIVLLERCDVLYLGDTYGISDGMRGEIERAMTLGIEIVKR